MGFYKELAMQQHERSCSTVDGWVCAECFDDYAIEAFIKSNAEASDCSYCGASSPEPIAASADDVAGLIMEAIQTEWVDPVEESPHESAEGGYLWNTSEFDDVLEQVGNPIQTVKFQEALTTATCDHTIQWLKRDYVAPYVDEAMSYDWERLVELVKWRSRYFFLLDSEGDDYSEPGQANGALEILERIASEAGETGLIRAMDAGTSFWRVRRHAIGTHFNSAAGLGTVPSEKSLASNRMSPAGTPAFYGSSDLNTALTEVKEEEGKPAWSAGLFETSKDSLILDFVDIPDPPSFYDADRRHLRRPLMFLRQFATEVSKPLEAGNREQIDYVPTQVVAEFFRHAFDIDGERINGIRYASAQVADGICVALFIEHDSCVDHPVGDGLSMVLVDTEHSGKEL
jgi:hypothetical protein